MERTNSTKVGPFNVAGFSSVEEAARYLVPSEYEIYNGCIIAINAEKVSSCTPDISDHINSLKGRALFYPDGYPIAWLMRRRGVASARIPGVELWLAIVDRIAKGSRTVYLLGSSPTVNDYVSSSLGIQLGSHRVYSKHGHDLDEMSVIDEVVTHRPDIMFIALGSPKQEILISRIMDVHPYCLYMGVGGSFDVFSGKSRRAPEWMQIIGLEWLFRFAQDPTRFRRYLGLFRFAWLVAIRRV